MHVCVLVVFMRELKNNKHTFFHAAVECGSLSSLKNGTIVLNGTIFQAVARYFCHVGFTLSGSGTRICTMDGMWSGTAPRCAGKVEYVHYMPYHLYSMNANIKSVNLTNAIT